MDREDFLTIIDIAHQDKHTKLDLSNRDISEIPEAIGQLTELEELNLSYNCITALPDSIGNLCKLKTLLLMRNDLQSLNPGLCQISRLKLLDISHNKLTSLPAEIGELSELTSLDASYCRLEKLPVELINLLSLKALYLENNPLVFPNQKIIKRGLYATMHFLGEVKRNREASKVVMQVFNLPQEIQGAFRQYIDCFHEVISQKTSRKVDFDINFITQDNENGGTPVNIDDYIVDFISFVKQNIQTFKDETQKKEKSTLLDLQVIDIKKQLTKLEGILDGRKNEIEIIQSELNRLGSSIDKLQ